MIGFLISISLFLGILRNASAAESFPWYAPYSYAGILLLLGVISGFVLVRTVGIAAVGATTGGVVGAVVALFNGAIAAAPGFLLIAVVGSLLQGLQKQRVLASGGMM